MFFSANKLCRFHIDATDGECGKVKDFLFDDVLNITRYIVVNTGGWLIERQVLISPVAVSQPDFDSYVLPTVLSKKNIEDSPAIQSDLPVSRQHEHNMALYYNWPMYWDSINSSTNTSVTVEPKQIEGDPHLRSVSEITGYHIQCMEGAVGHVEDLIIDTESWCLRYLIIDTRDWLPSKKVIIAFDWITHITWEDRKVHIDLTQNQVKNAPTYDPRLPVNRAYETQLYDFYGRPSYW
ncbi:PRC-barrel domain protein [Gimesia aquarii]|uniref:PRC-barrel domain protein n=2 Tax=Gimesia aquarii TaxID=2527964 RepID=A0A517WX51_9PLAN|nr:PRC-barrel domain protein [Gimesia aquarii]